MSGPPSVSVLVTCHDLGLYLEEAVDSVLQCSLRDAEVLVVDDGSTDPETVTLLDGFQRPRTEVLRTPNRGLAAARNLLIARARGRYLCALDADDRLHADYLPRAVATLEADPSLTFVSAWLKSFGVEEWEWRRERCDLPALLAEDTVLTAAVVRRDAVVAVGGYDERMPHPGDEDWDLWIRLARAGHRGTILPEVLFYYRRRGDSMGDRCQRGDTHLELWHYLLDKHADAYQEHLLEVLLLKEREIGKLLAFNHRLELDLGERLEHVARRQQEAERLERKLGEALQKGTAAAGQAEVVAMSHELAALDAECRSARSEVEALRRSWSWRVTAPGRWLYDLLRGRRSGGSP